MVSHLNCAKRFSAEIMPNTNKILQTFSAEMIPHQNEIVSTVLANKLYNKWLKSTERPTFLFFFKQAGKH